MDLLLFLVGAIGFIVSGIVVLLNLIRKKDKRKPLIMCGVCILSCIVGIAIAPSPSDNNEISKDNTIQTNSSSDKKVEVTQEQLDEKLKKDAVKADFVKLNGHSNENADLKVFIEGEISCVDYQCVIDVFPSFLISQKEGEGFGMYHVTNIRSIKDLKDGDIVKVYGTVDKETSNDGMVKINSTVIEKVSSKKVDKDISEKSSNVEIKSDCISELKLKPVMNGIKTEEIGKYGFATYNKEKLTDEAIVDFYNKNIKDSGLNWVVLVDERDNTKGMVFPASLNVFDAGTIAKDGSLERREKTGVIIENKITYQ